MGATTRVAGRCSAACENRVSRAMDSVDGFTGAALRKGE